MALDRPKMAQHGPNVAQARAKMAPDRPRMAQDRLEMAQNGSSTQVLQGPTQRTPRQRSLGVPETPGESRGREECAAVQAGSLGVAGSPGRGVWDCLGAQGNLAGSVWECLGASGSLRDSKGLKK